MVITDESMLCVKPIKINFPALNDVFLYDDISASAAKEATDAKCHLGQHLSGKFRLGHYWSL